MGRDWVAQDDEMMELALDQYLLDDKETADQVTLWEALQTQQDPDLQRAIQASLEERLEYSRRKFRKTTDGEELSEEDDESSGRDERERVTPAAGATGLDFDLELALKLSAEEKAQDDDKRREEEEILRRVLELSLQEK